ncbi:MAG: T9SS type A sorting domain-containing protein, partial [Bacteroidota bacterium]|nr:T9SS type A sorting domain-containing protein [Bacteroidota bacterium]MDX5430354.1 T9SS type A sorting domain-containing protein [Bacteroidota bacterium]MDX5469115.1 T9SS type A sorting domain-containing protein [Bacteroidota bacterium]
MKLRQFLSITLIAATGSLFAQGTLDSGLVRHFPFNGNADDATANAKHGTVYGASLTTNRFGDSNSAYLFNGSTDRITYDGAGCGNPAFSFSIWAKINWDSAYMNGVGAYGLMYIGNAAQNDHGVTTGAGGAQWTIGSYHTDATLSNVLSGVQPTTGQWHHLVLTRDADSIKLYLNGIQVGSVSPNGKAAGWNGTLEGVIGARPGPNSSYMFHFKGAIDDIRVYDRAINPTEVADLSNYSPTPGSAQKLKIRSVIYPNPVHSGNDLFITADEDLTGSLVNLYSLNGQLVHSTPYAERLTLPVLSSGTYFLRIDTPYGALNHK